MTVETVVTIHNPCGLHLRAAATMAKTACRFDARIHACNGVKSVDAKSTMGLVTLGAGQFDQVTFTADGGDADIALQAIELLVEACFEIGE